MVRRREAGLPDRERGRKLGSRTSVATATPFGQLTPGTRTRRTSTPRRTIDLDFIAYHSAWPYHGELAALKGFKPQRKNLYSEVGSTFAATVSSRPMECAHVLGTLLRDLGPDYVMWGTDSLLWGNPQWQIDAFAN